MAGGAGGTGKTLEDLPSPSFCIDVRKFKANCAAMAERCAKAGIGLRPHVKTLKTLEGARLMLAHVPEAERAIVVSTVVEAEHFAAGGFPDILYGMPVEPSKLPRLLRVAAMDSVQRLHIFIDSLDALPVVEAALAELQPPTEGSPRLGCFVKVDCGYSRAGVAHDTDEAVALVKAVAASSLQFSGLYSHSGNAYNTREGGGPEGAARVAREEVARISALANRCREAGVEVPVVTVGSTPACAAVDMDYSGVTECHPGNYPVLDRQQCACGSATLDRVACFVLARVCGRYPKRNELLVDAGGTALHKDSAGVADWGEIIGHPELRVNRLSQEHGVVSSSEPIDFAAFPLGATVRIIPNHSCMTAACHEVFYVYDSESDSIVDTWTPAKYW